MTVYALMPVFNRLELTKTMLECLREQSLDEALDLVVVDDGSSDGSGEFLQQQEDVTVLNGDGNLWWGGSMELAFEHVFSIANPEDWVLMVNNDTRINADFVQCLLDTARSRKPAAVGSIIRDEEHEHRLLSVGASIDSWWFLVGDMISSGFGESESDDLPALVDVDAISGRGALYPVSALIAAGGMRARWLPQYLADYELSLRVKARGYRSIVDTRAVVYSRDNYGSNYSATSLKERLFSVRSPAYLPAVVVFWWQASNWAQRLTAPLRLIVFILLPGLRKARR